MKVTKIKNIVIWTLVLINAFFLVVVLQGFYVDRSSKDESLINLSRLFNQSGVFLDIKSIHEGASLQDYTVRRDQAAEQALADALLGPTVKTSEGGNIYVYTSDKGTAEFASGGSFEVAVNSGAWLAGAGAISTVNELLKTMNIEAAAVTVTGNRGDETVKAICAAGDQPIFNCGIEFKFKDGWFLGVSGTLATVLTPASGKTDMSSSATALIRFLSDIKSKKITCKEITAVDRGYFLPPFTDNVGLIAVWRIETDAGIYFRDAVSGKQIVA